MTRKELMKLVNEADYVSMKVNMWADTESWVYVSKQDVFDLLCSEPDDKEVMLPVELNTEYEDKELLIG